MKPYYQENGIEIYHGDCREVLPTIWEEAELILTDPPYGEVNRESSGLRTLDKGAADVVTVEGTEIVRLIAQKGRSLYVWCGIEQISTLRGGFRANGLSTRLCFWEKTNPSPMNGEYLWLSSVEACVFGKRCAAYFGEFCASPVWRGPTESETAHPTEKPKWLFKRIVLASSRENQLVLDPFMGSGTTLVAAKDLGRRAIGIDTEERWCEIAAKRLSQEVFQFEGGA